MPRLPGAGARCVRTAVVRCAASLVVLMAASGCGHEAAAPTTLVWASHATLTGRVLLSDATVVPGARVTVAQVSGVKAFGQYAADSVTSDATGRFTLTVRATAAAASSVSPHTTAGVTLVAKDAAGGVIAESAGFTRFGPIAAAAPVNPRNIVAR